MCRGLHHHHRPRAPSPPPDHVYGGEYEFHFKRRKPLSSLVEPRPSFEEIVNALTDLSSKSELIRVNLEDETFKVQLYVDFYDHTADTADNQPSVQEFEVLMATLNSLNLTELDLPTLRDRKWISLLYRLRVPLRRLRASHTFFYWRPRPVNLQTFEVAERLTVASLTPELYPWLCSFKGGGDIENMVNICTRPRLNHCRLRCVCWDKCPIKQPWDRNAERDARANFTGIAELLAARRRRQKDVQVNVLGIFTLGEVLRRPTGVGLASLPPEILAMIMGDIGASLSHEAMIRAKAIAFDHSHLGTRARALKGMEGEEFGLALEEWLVEEGLVYSPAQHQDNGDDDEDSDEDNAEDDNDNDENQASGSGV